ncbi:hypothetical protein BST83_13300 [Polaribacter filamentus]|uniref:Uncharacterized protein n=1 Tax=Polaribacter filamentus TaxID=53483 RepID=A0A2S7KZH2_9FLAO|nr:hypothetical protein [Polaribacter filamentus]PQB08020.1 hypothetical protein BST83_13300 [Polaribacter filamentus]
MSNSLPRITLNDTTFDKVWAYYKTPGKVTLTPKQEQKRERWLTLFSLRLKFHSRLQAINAYIDLYKQKEIEISESQAYKDMSNALRLFGDVHKADRQASLVILQEYAHKVFLMAIKQKNPLAASAALTKMEKYMEIDRIDAINFNPAKLEDKPDHYSVPAIVLEAIKEQFKKGEIDFNNLEIEDIPHEEIQ